MRQTWTPGLKGGNQISDHYWLHDQRLCGFYRSGRDVSRLSMCCARRLREAIEREKAI